MTLRSLTRLARRLPRRLRNAARAEWYARWRNARIRPDVVVFESFSGNGMACNPEALFRAVLRADDLRHLRCVWAVDARTASLVRAEFRGDRRVRFVRRDGLAYWRALATAGTLVNNATFPPQFDRRPGQTYLNTWHGTPLKRMGFDEPDGAYASANVMRNFLQSDLLLSQNRYMTDTMYRQAYKLDGFAPARVLEVGYPRNDRLHPDDHEATAVAARLRVAGADPADGIVLYAPTWRGDRFTAPEDHSAELATVATAMQEALVRAGSTARVVVKPHQAVLALAREEPALRGRLAPEDLPVNALLAVTDVLVSDYSSIAVDFLATGRPVVFLGLDGDDYTNSRGLYIAPDQFPGRRCTDLDALGAEVVRAARDGIDPAYAGRYAAMAADLVAQDDGHASDRVLDVVFRGRPLSDAEAPRLDADRHRPSILVHLGGMRANGITSAAVNLLPALVDAGVDVTALYPRSDRAVARASRARIDPRVRQLQRMGGMNGSKVLSVARRIAARTIDAQLHHRDPRAAQSWNDEWHRCFGEARFDAVVDFSGYSPFWATLLLHAPEPTVRSIWMHNDMAAEVERLVGGKPTMRRSLRGVMALYDQYDRVVAVSEALRQHNESALTELAHVRFRAARNLVDDRVVLAGAAGDPEAVLRERDRPRGEEPPEEPWTRPAWLDELDDPAFTWFACVGRLSPEKNHERLIRAFARVAAERPDVRLLVVGNGWLRADLEALAARLGVEHAVVFTGAVRNPHAFVARTDCVVVSSDHEGQPMVILEAAVLGKPVVSTRFESAADALPDGGIELVDRSVDGVVAGLERFLAGAVPPAHLDVAAYDHVALEEFLDATLRPDATAGAASGSAPRPHPLASGPATTPGA